MSTIMATYGIFKSLFYFTMYNKLALENNFEHSKSSCRQAKPKKKNPNDFIWIYKNDESIVSIVTNLRMY